MAILPQVADALTEHVHPESKAKRSHRSRNDPTRQARYASGVVRVA